MERTPTPAAVLMLLFLSTGSTVTTLSPACGLALASLPQALFDARATYAANVNKIYVFGGLAAGTNVLSTTYIYDIATDIGPQAQICRGSFLPCRGLLRRRWKNLPASFTARRETSVTSLHLRHATDTWTPLAADPFVTDHYGSASGAFNGNVFVVGGTTAFSNAIWIYT